VAFSNVFQDLEFQHRVLSPFALRDRLKCESPDLPKWEHPHLMHSMRWVSPLPSQFHAKCTEKKKELKEELFKFKKEHVDNLIDRANDHAVKPGEPVQDESSSSSEETSTSSSNSCESHYDSDSDEESS